MSVRTREAAKAIRLAWEKEQALVREGKGTRDWTPEQQQDILDPDKGKAYDSEGKAFDGQHMKSVANYPELQGDPDNIQFLTKKEHLEAHRGSWQNPTNWYYDPVTKDYIEFKDDELIPCPIIKLSVPIVSNNDSSELESKSEPRRTSEEQREKSIKKPNIFKRAYDYYYKNQEIIDASLGAANMILSVAEPIVDNCSRSKVNDTSSGSMDNSSVRATEADHLETTSIPDSNEKADRASPIEHPVKGHTRHCGDKIINVAPYTRGGKKDQSQQ